MSLTTKVLSFMEMVLSSSSTIGWLAVAVGIACSLVRVGEQPKAMFISHLEAIC